MSYHLYTPSGVESTSETLMMSGELDEAGMKRNNISLLVRQTQNHVSLREYWQLVACRLVVTNVHFWNFIS